ncbi:Ankyrin repeat-containing protein [Cladophialophora immunda]|nr:Ankyrin repeat-containing protein [Cladophialophora immunda]
MEALSLAISVPPILENSVKSVRLYRGWKRVPDDLDRAAARVEKLQSIHEVSLHYGDLPEECKQLFPDAARAVVSMTKLLPKAITKRSKMRWLTGDREVFERLASEVGEDIQRAIFRLLMRLILAQTSNDLEHDPSVPMEAVAETQGIEITVTETEQWDAAKENVPVVSLRLQDCWCAGVWVYRKINRVFNVHGILTRIIQSIALLRVVPARRDTMQNLARRLQSAMHCLVSRRWLVALLNQGRVLGWYEVSPEHEFLRASKEGNVVRMRQLLVLRKASPFDATKEGITALCLAIQYGRHDAVKLLLTQGALVNRVFGVKQTSPLCWALQQRQLEICRTLLSYGASFDHVTAHNWSPLYYLWPWDMEVGYRHPLASEFITMLRAKGEEFHMLHEDHVDSRGWSLMHRAAIFAEPADLQLLMDYGVDPFVLCADSDWTPLHFVAEYGIPENFPILFQAYEKKFGSQSALELRDFRGWTPLHMATANGHFELVRTLLDLGADRKALTGPIKDRDLPEGIRGKKCSPRELAWAFGESRGHCFDDVAAAIPEDQWSDAPEYPEDNIRGRPFKLPAQLSKKTVKNISGFARRCRQLRQLLD